MKDKILLLFSFIVLTINFVLSTALDIYSDLTSDLLRIISLCLLISVYLKNATYFSYFSFLLLAMLYLISGNIYYLNFIFFLVFISVLKSFSIESVIKYSFFSILLGAFVHILAFNLNLIDPDKLNYIYLDRYRYTLGFKNPNQLAIYYFTLAILSFLMIRTNKILAWISMLVSIYIIYLSDSRTTLIGFFIFIILILLKHSAFTSIILKLTPFGALVITIIISLLKDTVFNNILSLRPEIYSDFINKFDGISILFGLNEDIIIDNFYLISFGTLGFIGLILLLAIITFYNIKAKPEFYPFIITLFIMSIFESFLIRPEFLLSIVYLKIITENNIKLKA